MCLSSKFLIFVFGNCFRESFAIYVNCGKSFFSNIKWEHSLRGSEFAHSHLAFFVKKSMSRGGGVAPDCCFNILYFVLHLKMSLKISSLFGSRHSKTCNKRLLYDTEKGFSCSFQKLSSHHKTCILNECINHLSNIRRNLKHFASYT